MLILRKLGVKLCQVDATVPSRTRRDVSLFRDRQHVMAVPSGRVRGGAAKFANILCRPSHSWDEVMQGNSLLGLGGVVSVAAPHRGPARCRLTTTLILRNVPSSAVFVGANGEWCTDCGFRARLRERCWSTSARSLGSSRRRPTRPPALSGPAWPFSPRAALLR